jgi:hypothetical protein
MSYNLFDFKYNLSFATLKKIKNQYHSHYKNIYENNKKKKENKSII